MKKDLYMKKPQDKVVIQSDDLIFDGKNIIIPSYYASVIYDYLSYVDQNTLQDADKIDYYDFLEFIENVIDHKNNKGN
jgi:hypothetical protein